VKYLVQPWKHQEEAIERSRTLDHFAFFFEQGAGKTMTAINACRIKYYDHKRLLRTLVLGPPIVRSNWVREWKTHSKINPNLIVMLDGPGKKRAEVVRQLKGEPHIVITNYESFRNEELLEAVLDWHPELIIFDESHKCKTYNSKTTKVCFQLAQLAKYRYILTGTPVLNSPSDLFSQFKILDLGKTFGKNYFAFRDKYFMDKNRNMPKHNYFPDWRPKPGIETCLNAKIKEKSMRMLKKDCLDLPPYVKTKVDVELTAEQKRVYEELKKDFVAYVSDTEAVVANMALTKALRLLQISTGFVCVEREDGTTEEKIFKKNPRDVALAEVIEGIPESEKIIIWAVFKRNYDTIRAVCKKLGVELVEVHGGISDKQKRLNVDAFNAKDGPRVLLGHPASAGIGINLVSASYSIFYSRTFNLGDDLQAEARNYRGGSEIHEKVTRIDLVAPGTIDEYVVESLAGKINLATRIVDIKEHV
jgi:SNF2 family DNA or RNA helicase